jgi:hypothetical protein
MAKTQNHTVLYQRVENGLVFLASFYFYFHLHFHWLWFIVFLFSIDIFMIGYLASNSLGAKLYNLGHNYGFPALLLAIGASSNTRLLIAVGIIWTAHVSMDRALGYGLKLPSGFKDTHLGRIK